MQDHGFEFFGLLDFDLFQPKKNTHKRKPMESQATDNVYGYHSTIDTVPGDESTET